jgi:hypothetical protein
LLSRSAPSPVTHDVLPSPLLETQIDQQTNPISPPLTPSIGSPLTHGGALKLDQPELTIPLRRSERQRHAPTRYGFYGTQG